MPRSGKRLPKSEATRLKLMECAVQEVLEVGPDEVGFTTIARRAQLSTGALYARYENVDELLLELWMLRGLPALRRLISTMEESFDSTTGKSARQHIAALLQQPDTDLVLVTKILTVARRREAIGEFVIPATQELVAKALHKSPAFDFYLGYVLGIVLGVEGTSMKGLDWTSPISIVASSCRDATEVESLEETFPSEPELTGLDVDLDEIDRRLFAAVSLVISRVGVNNATISRIARHADVNPASMYMRYEDRDALFVACIQHVMAARFTDNQRLLNQYSQLQDPSNSREDGRYGVIMFRGNQSDAYQQSRRLRLETMFAAAHDDRLQAHTRKVYEEMLLFDEQQLGFAPGTLAERHLTQFVLFSRFSFFGFALLREFGFVAPNHDHLVSFFNQISKRLSASTLNAE